MTPQNFKRFCADVRRRWSRDNGLVALVCTGGRKRVLRVCVSTTINQGLVAENCVVWDGSQLAYEGPFESDALRSKFTVCGVCRCEFLTGREMAAGRHGKPVCYGTGRNCPKACPLNVKRKTGDAAAKAMVEAIRAGQLVVLHEKVGMSVLNTDGVERTCMEVPKPETPDA